MNAHKISGDLPVIIVQKLETLKLQDKRSLNYYLNKMAEDFIKKQEEELGKEIQIHQKVISKWARRDAKKAS